MMIYHFGAAYTPFKTEGSGHVGLGVVHISPPAPCFLLFFCKYPTTLWGGVDLLCVRNVFFQRKWLLVALMR